jgi:hypothetical protein
MRDTTGRKVRRRAGEFLRDYALLVAVFFPLDKYVQGQRLTPNEGVLLFVMVAALWAFGVILDLYSNDE